MISNSFGDDLGDLGWGWKSLKKVGSAVKKVGQAGYSVAKLPAAAARRVASATASVLCDKSGNPQGSDATSKNFCRAVKLKQEASMRKYLPGAAAVASRVSQERRRVAAIRASANMSDPDTNLLASLAGADMNDLSFALSEVTPSDLNGFLNKENAMLYGPALIAVGLGLYLLRRS